jgi:alkyl hydroperoxide reductase subunit AhpC
VLLRQRHQDLQGLGVQVVAISVDHVASLRVFDAALAQFPFPLAADWHRGICRAYGVLNEEAQAARRVLALYDGGAVLRAVVDPFDPAVPDQFAGLLAAARQM